MTQLTHDNAIQTLHVRFDGRSEELQFAAIGLDQHSADRDIKQALVSYFDRPAGYFDKHVVVRHGDVIVVRPEAIYG